MKFVPAEEIRRVCPPRGIVEVLRKAFQSMCEVPERLVYETSQDGNGMLIMPAWDYDGFLGVKLITTTPSNPKAGRPFIQGTYLLFDHTTGTPLAHMPAGLITNIRTSATSALASDYLSRSDSRILLMVGSGSLAPYLIAAHRAVRPIDKVFIWSRNHDAARQLAESGIEGAEVVTSLQEATWQADIIACATGATEPLIQGDWLQPGQHVDLVGGYKPHMRETDDLALVRSEVYIDTDDAFLESGELIQALHRGTWRKSLLRGTLPELASRAVEGRKNNEVITLFKSVGHAIEDIATAAWIWQKTQHGI